MSGEHVFVDTNVLVYAHDLDAGPKYRAAKELVTGFWDDVVPPAISVQVLQELYVTLLRKGVSAADATEVARVYRHWRVIDNDVGVFTEGLRLRERWGLSPWDAWIVAAAVRAGATRLLTEDMSDGQGYDSLVVTNPFASNG